MRRATLPLDPAAVGASATAGFAPAAALALVAALLGAVLGGLAGMRFHRRVDRAAVDQEPLPVRDGADGAS